MFFKLRRSFLMLVLLSRDEPSDAVGPQDGVQSKACDEEDGEDQQPVDAPHRDAGEGAQAVWLGHVSVGDGLEPWDTKKPAITFEQTQYFYSTTFIWQNMSTELKLTKQYFTFTCHWDIYIMMMTVRRLLHRFQT